MKHKNKIEIGTNNSIMILGPLPPPYIGPSVATEILKKSHLRNQYSLHVININVHSSIESIGKFTLKSFFKNIFLSFDFTRVLLRRRPQLILIPIGETSLGFMKNSVFILISFFFSRRIVVQHRGGNFRNWMTRANFLVRAYVKLILKKTNGVIVLGDSLVSMFSGYFERNKIFVIPNGANLSYRSNHQLRGEYLHLLFLSNIFRSKGIVDILLSLCLFEKTMIGKLRLQVVGEWGDKHIQYVCQRIVDSFDLPVTFHHGIHGQDKSKYYETADVFVFTPREQEGHPWVIVEALAASLPIISTDQGAIRESVINEYNGFIVHPHRPVDIFRSILRLYENKGLISLMGQRSKSIYEQQYTENIMVKKYINCFNQLLHQ